jgi:uncharacterized membrane protein YphA (DoxX/SURF4 family)
MITYKLFNVFIWLLRLIAAGILVQSLFFKFTAAPESIYIFSELGVEPWGRIGLGIIELITAVLLLLPRTTYIGAALAVVIMLGAIFSHLFVLGIEVQNDEGLLFILALSVLITSATLLFVFKENLLSLVSSLKK